MDINQKHIDYNFADNDTIVELFYEINNHLLLDEKPSEYLNEIVNTAVFQEYPFNLLYKMLQTEQSPHHHPEGNVWNHTMLVVDQAAKNKNKSKDQKIFMWAALLHDIGKPSTTKNRKGKITAYDHEKVGEELTKDFLKEFVRDDSFIEKVSSLVRWHMQILHVVKNLPFADVKSMKSETDYKEIALLGYCDRLGRTKVDVKKEIDNINEFLKKCKNDI